MSISQWNVSWQAGRALTLEFNSCQWWCDTSILCISPLCNAQDTTAVTTAGYCICPGPNNMLISVIWPVFLSRSFTYMIISVFVRMKSFALVIRSCSQAVLWTKHGGQLCSAAASKECRQPVSAHHPRVCMHVGVCVCTPYRMCGRVHLLQAWLDNCAPLSSFLLRVRTSLSPLVGRRSAFHSKLSS